MYRKLVISAAAALVAAFATVAPSTAQDKTVIRLGWTTPNGEKDPYAIGARAYKAALEKASGGSIEVELFPNRQLGDEKPMLEGIRFGTVDAAVITSSVVAQIEPGFQVIDLPFLFASQADADKLLDGPVAAELSKRLASKNIVALGYMDGGFRNMINNKKPVRAPADVAGVKYRVVQNPIFIDTFKALGGAAVPMAWGETFTAVQQGTIDGLDIPLAVIDSSKFYEVTKYLSMTNHSYFALALLMSKRTLDKLSPAQKEAVASAARTAVQSQRAATAANARELHAGLVAKGMTVNTVDDLQPFRAAVAPVYEKYRPVIGANLVDTALGKAR